VFTKAISTDTLRGLRKLGESGILGKAYLAGGTALALQLGHRLSLDLDFFTQEVFEELTLENKLKNLGGFERERIDWRTVLGTFEKVKFSYFYYEYPLVSETILFENVQLATPPDVAVMKLQAISDRGARRDFIDMYFMRELFSLEQVFEWYDLKFGNMEERKYQLLKGLQYFEDAETEEMPDMLIDVDWENVKRYFVNVVKRLSIKWKI